MVRRKKGWLPVMDAVKALAEAWRIAEALGMKVVLYAFAWERRQKDNRFWELQILTVDIAGTNQYFFNTTRKSGGSWRDARSRIAS